MINTSTINTKVDIQQEDVMPNKNLPKKEFKEELKKELNELEKLVKNDPIQNNIIRINIIEPTSEKESENKNNKLNDRSNDRSNDSSKLKRRRILLESKVHSFVKNVSSDKILFTIKEKLIKVKSGDIVLTEIDNILVRIYCCNENIYVSPE